MEKKEEEESFSAFLKNWREMREWKRAWFAGPRSPFCYTPSCVRVRERETEREMRACVCVRVRERESVSVVQE